MTRPTIPFAQWRIAVDLPATRFIDSLPGREAVGCECIWCRNWSVVYDRALPVDVRQQLARLGADPAHPSDSYPHREDPLEYRLLYHCVGRILSGPNSRIDFQFPGTAQDDPFESVANFTSVAEAPSRVAAVVWYERTAHHGPQQRWPTEGVEPLIRIDVLALAPWGLSEPMPRRPPPEPVRASRTRHRGRAS